ncbi:MAG: hydrogenase iron-sulfur subunit [Candidatus Bathyarchaeota archaeon]|jgi:coenzyme F420-reducing hydrogenase delta subunit|nr:hydrogenase iron-sulfur subunit [Candidatus Bathyarchaeota archaeon]
MSEPCAAAITINQDYCSRCSICYSICPYEAIKRDAETGKVEIDLQKCQVCGICYSACPSLAIEIVYYDYESLLNYVNCMREKEKSDTLVLMCRGNSPATCEVEEILQNEGLNIKNYIPLRIPCSGRVPTEFIFKALNSGIKNIVSIQCEDEFCRFKRGTKINTRRLMLGKAVLEQLGFSKEALKVIRYSHKAVYDTEKCVGCDKCVFICPYGAIEAEEFATPRIIQEECMGCGACALVCPHLAIQVKGFEFENISKLVRLYGEAARKMKTEASFPSILVFCCQWSEFSCLDDPECLLFKKKAVVMEIPCFKALDPVHVVEALHSGFDGVMAVVCSAEDCKLQEGRETADRNMDVLKNFLKKSGMLERFELFTASPRCVGEFNQKFEEFFKKITSMPSLKIETAEAKESV